MDAVLSISAAGHEKIRPGEWRTKNLIYGRTCRRTISANQKRVGFVNITSILQAIWEGGASKSNFGKQKWDEYLPKATELSCKSALRSACLVTLHSSLRTIKKDAFSMAIPGQSEMLSVTDRKTCVIFYYDVFILVGASKICKSFDVPHGFFTLLLPCSVWMLKRTSFVLCSLKPEVVGCGHVRFGWHVDCFYWEFTLSHISSFQPNIYAICTWSVQLVGCFSPQNNLKKRFCTFCETDHRRLPSPLFS